MFSAFNITADLSKFNIPINRDSGKKLIEEQNKRIIPTLKDITKKGISLEEQTIEANWFPTKVGHYNIFLSHSHQDFEDVLSFAGWLNQCFNINPFIDSCVWGNANDLLREIDDEYCVSHKNEKGEIETYDYRRRNSSTAHVHIILNTALQKMIDQTECVMFLNTPNSVSLGDEIQDTQYTYSPWIYSELMTTELIHRKKLKEYRNYPITNYKARQFAQNNLMIKYPIPIKHMIELSDSDMIKWQNSSNEYSSAEESLDALYGLIEERING